MNLKILLSADDDDLPKSNQKSFSWGQRFSEVCGALGVAWTH